MNIDLIFTDFCLVSVCTKCVFFLTKEQLKTFIMKGVFSCVCSHNYSTSVFANLQ